jgi:hypothetical protein
MKIEVMKVLTLQFDVLLRKSLARATGPLCNDEVVWPFEMILRGTATSLTGTITSVVPLVPLTPFAWPLTPFSRGVGHIWEGVKGKWSGVEWELYKG